MLPSTEGSWEYCWLWLSSEAPPAFIWDIISWVCFALTSRAIWSYCSKKGKEWSENCKYLMNCTYWLWQWLIHTLQMDLCSLVSGNGEVSLLVKDYFCHYLHPWRSLLVTKYTELPYIVISWVAILVFLLSFWLAYLPHYWLLLKHWWVQQLYLVLLNPAELMYAWQKGSHPLSLLYFSFPDYPELLVWEAKQLEVLDWRFSCWLRPNSWA